MSEYRIKRVENMIRSTISEMIMKGAIKDPRISTLTSISHVELAKDLSFAKIYISGFENENKISKCVDGLNSAAGFIQKSLGKTMRTRVTPKLKFIYDTSIKEGFEMNQKIDSIEKDAEKL